MKTTNTLTIWRNSTTDQWFRMKDQFILCYNCGKITIKLTPEQQRKVFDFLLPTKSSISMFELFDYDNVRIGATMQAMIIDGELWLFNVVDANIPGNVIKLEK